MGNPVALAWDLLAKDNASPTFLRVAAAADKTAASTLKATTGMEASAARMSAAGAKLTKTVTLPLLGIGAVAVDQAAKFQTSMNTIRVATDQTAASMSVGTKGLESIAKSTGTSLSQLSDSLYTATKAGQPMAQALDTVKAAAQGAKAEHVDLSVATQALTSIMASYGKSLGNPVAAENELIKGAGLAKTTYQDFAASLSNVVPIAASLHISFAQVAGAIDTMTQHGETAQRATDNLSNLITNLAGSNNVASKALGQLGVNSVDLSKTLASPNGLSAALDTVLVAVNKHGKDGMIVTSAFKQAQLATQSLQSELGSMSGALKTNSAAFANGTEGYKTYLAYAKSLGGQQYEMAKNFITTMTASKGFNTALTSGNSTVKTLAGSLKTALGGVTGMRTALMLSGTSAETFADSAAAVGKAAHATTGDVLGWSTTQATLAVKVDKAKESLQVMAVEIGTALIPVVTKVVDEVTKAVGWFSNLSDGWKTTIEVAALVLVALGPVLSIIGNLTKAFGLLAKVFSPVFTGLATLVTGFDSTAVASGAATAQIAADEALLAAAVSDNAARIELDKAREAAAFAETAVEVAAAAESSGSSIAGIATASAEAAIETAASYAAIAKAALETAATQATAAETAAAAVADADAAIVASAEETGAASSVAFGPIGIAIGAVVGVGALAAHALGLFGGAAKTAIKPEQDLTQAILTNNGALGSNVRAIIASKLANDGAYDSALKLGIPIKTLTDAAMGQTSALKTVSAATAEYMLMTGGDSGKIQFLAKADQARAKAALSLNKNLGDVTGTLKASQHIADQEAAAQSTAGKNTSAHAKALKDLVAIQKTATDATSGLDRNVGAYGTSIKSNSAYLVTALKDYQNLTAAQVLSGTSVADATAIYGLNTETLYKQATAAGINGTAVEKLIGKYTETPKQIVTNMLLNINKATASASELQKTINAVRQGDVPGLSANSAQGRAVIAAFQSRIDALQGTKVKITADTSDAVASLERFIDTPSVKYVQVVTTGGGLPASGGHTDMPSGHARGGSVADGLFTVGEQGYELGRKVGSHVEIYSHAQSVAMTGMDKVPGYASGTGSITHSGKNWIYQGISYASERAAHNAEVRRMASLAKSQAAAQKTLLHTVSGDARGVAGYAAAGNLSSLTTKLTNLRTALSDAGVRSSWIGRIAGDSTRLEHATSALSKASAALAAAKAVKATDVANTKAGITGSFDITSAGQDASTGAVTGGSILAASTQAVARAKAFYSGLSKLTNEKVLPADYIRAIAAKGPDDLAEVSALLSLPKSQLNQLRVNDTALNNYGSALGNTVGGVLDNAAIAKAQSTVSKDERAINVDTKALAKDLASALVSVGWKTTVTVKGPDLVIALKAATKQSSSTRGAVR